MLLEYALWIHFFDLKSDCPKINNPFELKNC